MYEQCAATTKRIQGQVFFVTGRIGVPVGLTITKAEFLWVRLRVRFYK